MSAPEYPHCKHCYVVPEEPCMPGNHEVPCRSSKHCPGGVPVGVVQQTVDVKRPMTLRRALYDPGSYVARKITGEPDHTSVETLTDWQARAVAFWLRYLAEDTDSNVVHVALFQLATKVEEGKA